MGAMDFDDTPEDAAFRAEARAWLEANVGDFEVDPDRGGESMVFADVSDTEYVTRGKAWQRVLFDGGYAGRGCTYFIVDMHAPGVTVRPLRQMTGGASFNEVFLDDVRIPDSERVDAVGNGWSVAVTTLMNERLSIGANLGGGAGMGFDRVLG